MIISKDFPEWTRKGRGRSCEFFATDEEVVQLLAEALPKAYRPYGIVGCLMTEIEKGRCEQRFRGIPLDQFHELRARGIWQFFVVSQLLSPGIELHAVTELRTLSFNGLVNVQQGRKRKDLWQPCSLGIVDEVVNNRTGQVVKHIEYLSIYTALLATLKNILTVKTQRVWPDERDNTSKQPRMSQMFADLCKRGALQAVNSPFVSNHRVGLGV